MTITELQRLYAESEIVEAVIEPSLQANGWVVEFRHRRGGFVTLTDGSGSEKCYRDIDTATERAFEVGFHQVRIADHF
ncbi:thymidylate kinase [Photobacterium sp. WH77]|uniref:Thymidylate kinase n=1 Tax=Photobacterium arenosum TaxID=2774143 RepID=A0ABR9BRK9_9GAMM|nr:MULTISPECIES: thymidylate kinase [Photobacterium]MBD8515215.1 thymidylate kinase [Photobacterium arenosum]MBV7264129.1 thymidylate kinase [Photobacterium sp. WH24]MCG2838922.1 thymidylate kinase [Photobacterium sp. WH77]MCG2846539.1 thymidylate kinase [Photobacterium sp. WH80]MDO6583231.1 thymidylate kinase [Photobacterium sp. 2_MG-2023]